MSAGAGGGEFERVFTMGDYYDGPRGGIASVGGRPHVYASTWADRDGAPDVFELRPIDDATLALALEDWDIWLRWEDAFYAATATTETHPALPADRARHAAIAPLLERRLAALTMPPILATVEFRPMEGYEHAGRGRWLEARWTVIG